MELTHQQADLGGRERAELDPLDASHPAPLSDLGPQRVSAVQVVGAVGHHEPTVATKGRENRKLSISRVDWSAQWASSMTTRTGDASAAASSTAWTASNSSTRSRCVRRGRVVGHASGAPAGGVAGPGGSRRRRPPGPRDRCSAVRSPRRTAGRAGRCHRSRGSDRRSPASRPRRRRHAARSGGGSCRRRRRRRAALRWGSARRGASPDVRRAGRRSPPARRLVRRGLVGGVPAAPRHP